MTEGVTDLPVLTLSRTKEKLTWGLLLRTLSVDTGVPMFLTVLFTITKFIDSVQVQLKINKEYIYNIYIIYCVYIYNGVFIYKEECNCDICWKMDGTGNHHAN